MYYCNAKWLTLFMSYRQLRLLSTKHTHNFVSISVHYVAVRTIVLSRHWSNFSKACFHLWYHSWPYMCQVLNIVDFLGSRRVETALRPLRLIFVQVKVGQTSHLIYVVFWAPRHDIAARMAWCIQHLVFPGGHSYNYGQGSALLNFSDRADTDELTP